MPASPHVEVRIDLGRICDNAQKIQHAAGVKLLAVVKADAYGHGAARVAAALAPIADGFCVFSVAEAAEANIWANTGKESLTLGPNPGVGVEDYLAQHVRPAVWDVGRARALLAARPVLSVDTGMQRFACPPDDIDAVLQAGQCDQAFTHATDIGRVHRLLALVGGRGLMLHAAGSSLLDIPAARLDAVRPGLSLYRAAARISTRLIDTRPSHGPVGYTNFTSTTHHGVILAGYSHGLRPGPCLINSRRSRVLEVGMQTSFVQTTESDQVGDEVVLLGDALTETEIAADWKTSPHEALTRMCNAGVKGYAFE